MQKVYKRHIPLDECLFSEMVKNFAEDYSDFSKKLGYSRTAVPAAVRSKGLSVDMIRNIYMKFNVSPNDYLKNGIYASWNSHDMSDLTIQEGLRKRRRGNEEWQPEWKKSDKSVKY